LTNSGKTFNQQSVLATKLNIKLKKWHKALLVLFSLFIILLIFLPSIARSHIEKNSIELVGRKIVIEDIDINYFKLSLRVVGFKMYEQDQVEEFVSFDEFYVDYHLWPIFQNEISISDINLINPSVHIEVKNDSTFNFSDLMVSTDSLEVEDEDLDIEMDTTFKLLPLKIDIDGIDILGGTINLEEGIKSQQAVWEDLNLIIPKIAWDNTQSNVEFGVKLGPTAKLYVTTDLDPISGDFDLGFDLEAMNLSFFKPYIEDFLKINDFNGYFDLLLELEGSVADPEATRLGGALDVTNIDIKESGEVDLFSLKRFHVGIEKISLRDSIIHLNAISVEEPAINVALAKAGGTNFDRVLSPLMTVEEEEEDQSEEVEDTSQESAELPFEIKLDSFQILDARLDFYDSTLTIPFKYTVSDFDFSTYGLDNKLTRLPIEMSALLNNTGKFEGSGMLNPSNPMDLTFEAHVDDMQLVPFTNYSLEYIARPIERGTYFYDMSLVMTETSLVNNNRIRFEQIRFGDRVQGQEKKVKVPIKTAIYMVEDPDGFADFDVDVKGNPSDPNFKIWPIVWQTLGNTLVKVALEPFNFLSKSFGIDPEKVKKIELSYLQDSVSESNIESLETILKIHDKKPDLKFGFVLVSNPEIEKERFAVRKMKGLYLVDEQNIHPDSIENYVSTIDESKFKEYLDKRAGQPIDDVGAYALNSFRSSATIEFEELQNQRIRKFEEYFNNNAGDNFERRVRIASLNRMRTEKPVSPYFEVVVSTKGEEFFSEENKEEN